MEEFEKARSTEGKAYKYVPAKSHRWYGRFVVVGGGWWWLVVVEVVVAVEAVERQRRCFVNDVRLGRCRCSCSDRETLPSGRRDSRLGKTIERELGSHSPVGCCLTKTQDPRYVGEVRGRGGS